MFYFTCNESKYMKVSLFEITYKKKWTFHNILIYWYAPVDDLKANKHELKVSFMGLNTVS